MRTLAVLAALFAALLLAAVASRFRPGIAIGAAAAALTVAIPVVL